MLFDPSFPYYAIMSIETGFFIILLEKEDKCYNKIRKL